MRRLPASQMFGLFVAVVSVGIAGFAESSPRMTAGTEAAGRAVQSPSRGRSERGGLNAVAISRKRE